MKLLVGFALVCAALLAASTWYLLADAAQRGAAPTASVPAVVLPDPAGETSDEAAATPAPTPTTAPAAPAACAPPSVKPTSQALVHWAGDPEARAAARRLQLAKATLRDDPYHPLALRDLVTALAALRRWSEAADALARLVELRPEDGALRFEHGTLLLRAQRWTAAISVLKSVVEQDATHQRAWFNLAMAHQAAGHLASAQAAWDRAIALAPTAEALAHRGEVLLDLQQWSAAAADFEAVLEQQPDAVDAVLNLSLALWRSGRVDEARVRLTSLLDNHPCHVPALNRLAEISASQPEAVIWWQRSLECDPQQSEVRRRLEEAQQAAPAAQR